MLPLFIVCLGEYYSAHLHIRLFSQCVFVLSLGEAEVNAFTSLCFVLVDTPLRYETGIFNYNISIK